jgi:hypothetical protein
MPDLSAVPALLREQSQPRSPQHRLLAELAEAVLAVPGVVRLEPTISTAGPSILLRPSPTDGIHVIDRAGVADVDISLATSAACEARTVTHLVQTVVAKLLEVHGYTRGSVAVSVLTIHPGPS